MANSKAGTSWKMNDLKSQLEKIKNKLPKRPTEITATEVLDRLDNYERDLNLNARFNFASVFGPPEVRKLAEEMLWHNAFSGDRPGIIVQDENGVVRFETEKVNDNGERS